MKRGVRNVGLGSDSDFDPRNPEVRFAPVTGLRQPATDVRFVPGRDIGPIAVAKNYRARRADALS
jgi:hypothetical protein